MKDKKIQTGGLVVLLTFITLMSREQIQMQDFQHRMLSADPKGASYKTKYCDGKAFSVTAEQTDNFNSMKSDYATDLANQPMSKFLSGELSAANFAMDYMIKHALIFIIFFVFAILCKLCYCCYCYCSCCTDKLCKCCCCCCNRDYDKKPIQNKEIRMLNIIVTILGCVLIGLFSASLGNATKIGQNIKKVCCAMVTMPYNLADGVTYDSVQWIGLEQLATDIDTISTNLQSNIDKILTTVSDVSWIKSYEDQIQLVSLPGLHTTYSSKTVSSPKPGSAAQEMNYMKNYIQQSSTDSRYQITLVYLMNEYFKTTVKASTDAISSLSSSSTQVNNKMAGIKSGLSSGSSAVRSLRTSTLDLGNTFGSAADSLHDIFSGQIVVVMELIFIILIIITVTQLVIMVLTFLKPGCKCFRFFLHFFWISLQILMIISFLCLAIMNPLNFIFVSICDIMQGVLGSANGYTKYKTPSSIENVIKQINVCFRDGSGDISKSESINISSQLDMIKSVQTSFNSALNQTADISALNTAADTVTNAALTQVNKLIALDKTSLATETTYTDERNPTVALETLNKYSDKNVQSTLATSCNLQDKYVFSTSSDCGDYPVASSVSDKLNSKACIAINQFTEAEFDTRYSGYSCGASSASQKSTFKTKFTALRNYAIGTKNEYTSLKTATELIKQSSSSSDKTFYSFNTQLGNQLNSVQGIKDVVNSFMNSVLGLLNALNCKFIGTDLSNLIDAFCVVMLPYFYKTVRFFAFGMFVLFFENFFIYILAYKFARYDHKKMKNVNNKRKVQTINTNMDEKAALR